MNMKPNISYEYILVEKQIKVVQMNDNLHLIYAKLGKLSVLESS